MRRGIFMVILGHHYTYEEIMACIGKLTERYPEILRFEEAGFSHDERCIPGIRLGHKKECLICSAGVHGRETINPILMLRLIEEYCQSYENEPLLQEYSIYFLPLVNPDGYEIALRGYEALRSPVLRHASRMRGIPSETWKCNGRGVDINRNFPCSSYLPGNGSWQPASENETKAVMDAFCKYPDSIGYIDFHSRGRIIYYYRNAMPPSYNEQGQKIARSMQRISHYELGGEADEWETAADGGNSVNYYSEVFKKPALTVETVEDEAGFPLDAAYQERAYLEIKELPLVYLRKMR